MTAPTVTVLPKPETVLDVDLSAEVLCAACSTPASGVCVVDPCRHSAALCDRHYRMNQMYLAMGAMCTECGTLALDLTWRRL